MLEEPPVADLKQIYQIRRLVFSVRDERENRGFSKNKLLKLIQLFHSSSLLFAISNGLLIIV